MCGRELGECWCLSQEIVRGKPSNIDGLRKDRAGRVSRIELRGMVGGFVQTKVGQAAGPKSSKATGIQGQIRGGRESKSGSWCRAKL